MFYRAKVVNAEDPQGIGRVQIVAPQILGASTTGWAKPMIEGIQPPTAGDFVWLTFEGGDTSFPLFMPTNWSGV